MSNALALLSDPAAFEHAQRVAKMYASSELIPPHLRGKVADVTIALTMAQAMGENPVIVMQNIYVVSGRAGWSSAYVIAKANASGVFRGRMNWRIEGAGPGLKVTAFARLADTDEEVSYTVSMAMAEAEGWTKNPKYKTMPELMLRYRSGAALVRLYAWDVMFGYATVDELETMPVEVVDVSPGRGAASTARAALGQRRAAIEAAPEPQIAPDPEKQPDLVPAATDDEENP